MAVVAVLGRYLSRLVGGRRRPVSALKSFGLFKQARRVNSQRLSGPLVGNGAS